MNETLTTKLHETGRENGAAVEALFKATQDGVTLTVTVNEASSRHFVLAAQVSGTRNSLEKRVLEQVCSNILKRPLQEAADHGVIYAMETLASDCLPIHGIRTSHNAGPPFRLAEALLRCIHASACEHFKITHRENGWYVRPAKAWLDKSETEQAGQIKPILTDFLRGKGMAEGDIWITRIERGTRITISFENAVSYAIKPQLMRELEHQLRRETGNPLELFMEEKKDANKLRRL